MWKGYLLNKWGGGCLLFSSARGEVCLRQGLSQAEQRIVLADNQSCSSWTIVALNQAHSHLHIDIYLSTVRERSAFGKRSESAARIWGPPLMTHFLSSLTDWNQVKKVRGKKKGHQLTWVRLSVASCSRVVRCWLRLQPLQATCAGCPLTQETLFKSRWKSGEQSGSGGREGVPWLLSWWCVQSDPARHIWCFSSPLSAPACNLFASLCQRRLSSSC